MKKRIRKFITWFYLNHSKLYTLIVLLLGISLGCMYEGRGDTGEHYFNVLGHTFYMGWIQ